MLKKISIIFILIFLVACSGEVSETNTTNQKLQVFTTIYPLAYFTEVIGDQYVDVSSILPAGSDPHNFEPTSKTMVDIAEADLFVFNGAELEVFAGKISSSLSNTDVTILEAADGIELGEAHSEEEHHDHSEDEEGHEGHNYGDIDPHIWLDPQYAVEMAENIKEALVTLQPEQENDFEDNYQALKERLLSLDEQFQEQLSQTKRKEIVVTHAAYGYWEERYGLEQIAITGISPSDEPSQKKLEEIIEFVKENAIEYILFEQNIRPKVAEVIQKEAGVDVLSLHNLSVLTEEDIEQKEDYFSLMEKNLVVLKKALN